MVRRKEPRTKLIAEGNELESRIGFQRIQSQMMKVGNIAIASHSPKPLWNLELHTDKGGKKGISRQAQSSWEQDSLAISIEPMPRERKILRPTITHLNLICQTGAPSLSLLFQLTAMLPAMDMLNHPPVPQLMSHKALCSSNPLIAWSCISVTVANSLPNWNFIILLYKSQQGSWRSANHLLTLSNLDSHNCRQKIGVHIREVPFDHTPGGLQHQCEWVPIQNRTISELVWCRMQPTLTKGKLGV